MSPTILREGSFRFFFYSGDRSEPEHVHVEAGDGEAKFWLSPVQLERSHGLNARELSKIEALVTKHQDTLSEAWHDFFNG